ncbi:hypothetical protein SGLAM104S_01089 [Streptomyces glaucescens]
MCGAADRSAERAEHGTAPGHAAGAAGGHHDLELDPALSCGHDGRQRSNAARRTRGAARSDQGQGRGARQGDPLLGSGGRLRRRPAPHHPGRRGRAAGRPGAAGPDGRSGVRRGRRPDHGRRPGRRRHAARRRRAREAPGRLRGPQGRQGARPSAPRGGPGHRRSPRPGRRGHLHHRRLPADRRRGGARGGRRGGGRRDDRRPRHRRRGEDRGGRGGALSVRLLQGRAGPRRFRPALLPTARTAPWTFRPSLARWGRRCVAPMV